MCIKDTNAKVWCGRNWLNQSEAGAVPPEVKRLKREADYSPPPIAEVKDCGATPPLPHASLWRGA
jgi:hypothetical protein